jgi:hypothetical protein
MLILGVQTLANAIPAIVAMQMRRNPHIELVGVTATLEVLGHDGKCSANFDEHG